MKKGTNIFVSTDAPRSTEELLGRIFWKNQELIPAARDFLDHVKEWSRSGSPHEASDWDKYCQKKKITQSSYHNMLRRLKKAGLVVKTYNKNTGEHEIHPSSVFSENLMDMARLWDSYLRS